MYDAVSQKQVQRFSSCPLQRTGFALQRQMQCLDLKAAGLAARRGRASTRKCFRAHPTSALSWSIDGRAYMFVTRTSYKKSPSHDHTIVGQPRASYQTNEEHVMIVHW